MDETAIICDDVTDYSECPLPAESQPGLVGRSRFLPLVFAPAILLCGLSWLGSGIWLLTDCGFLLLAACCAALFVHELVIFPRRFGIGGIVLYSGVLVWFVQDYLSNWFGGSGFDGTGTEPWVVAKGACLLSILVLTATLGLRLGAPRWLCGLLQRVPDTVSPGFYIAALIAAFVVGVSPYFLFTQEPWYQAIPLAMSAMRTGEGVRWLVGRSGNLNYSWGGYIGMLIDIGYFSGVFGAFVAILIVRSLLGKLIGWSIWLFWILIAFGSGTRGLVVQNMLPVAALLYIKHQAAAAEVVGRLRWQAYLYAAVIMAVLQVAVQFQGTFRTTRIEQRGLSQVQIFKLIGNSMFSEGLPGLRLVPDQVPFFCNRFPGEGLARVIPDMVIAFVIHPIPRALWTDKPVDETWEWYNGAYQGRIMSRNGTTIAPGLAAGSYMRYGILGLAEYGIIFGVLLSLCERLLQEADGRGIQIIISMAIAVWLFRSFRGGLGWGEFYSVALGITLVSLMAFLARPFVTNR